MKIATNMLKRFIKNVPSYEKLYELTNEYITEVEGMEVLVTVEGLVVGHILECWPHPNSDHLSVCMVDVGSNEPLQIICGASNVRKDQYVIVALEGTKFSEDFEIKKTEIRGVSSSGMICSLNELGIDEKHIEERFKAGIYYFDEPKKVGSSALEALSFDQASLELSITPNRSDLLSVLGFSYDLAAVLNEKLINPEIEVIENGPFNPLEVKIEDEGCKRYYARYVDNITIKPSPMWLQSALIASGIRPINNVVDVTNFVLLELGTPLHAFDAEKFGSEKIVIRRAKDLEEVITLDEQRRILRKDDIVITNGIYPVAIGGVMGLLNTAVTEFTTKIILEAAWFEPTRIKQTAERLNLHSDSSLRFEKGVDEIRVLTALNRAAELLTEISNARVYKEVSFDGKPFNRPTLITLKAEDVNRLLGTNLSHEEVKTILKRLNIIETKPNIYLVPSYRKDLTIKEDLIEEVGRIYGYNNIENVLPTFNSVGKYSNRQRYLNTVRNHLIGLGFNEVINYSLTNKEDIHKFVHTNKDIVEILSPLSTDRTVLRHSLVGGLVNNVKYHLSRQTEDLMLFEVGRVYYKDSEPTHLSAIINGKCILDSIRKNEVSVDYRVIKGVLENISEKLGLEFKYEKEDTIKGYHPGICAKVIYNKETIGHIGKIHPTILDDAYAFEINLEPILPNLVPFNPFEAISKYPSITRDLSMIVDNSIKIADILNLITQTTRRYLTDVRLFDVYEDESLGENKKSLAFTMTFNSKEKTLEASDVDKLINSVIIRLERELKVEVRK